MATISLKAYDVSVSCEFEITSREEEREQAQARWRYNMEHAIRSSVRRHHGAGWFWRLFPGVPVTEEEVQEILATQKFIWPGDAELDNLRCIKDMADYVANLPGDQRVSINQHDFQMLMCNLAG